MPHIYHWKHGWIPLDHAAALSKAKGSDSGARRYLAQSHRSGHAHGSVVEGSYGGGTHVRGLQPVAAEHLPRQRHITAAFDPVTRKFALLDSRGQRVGLANEHDGRPVSTAIPEHLAEHFHAHGHSIEGVKKTADGDRVLVRTKTGDLKLFRADGTDKARVDVAPHTVQPHDGGHSGDDRPAATHTVEKSHLDQFSILRPVGGGRGEIISRRLGDHLTSNDYRVTGYNRKVVTAVHPSGEVHNFKADGSNVHDPVKVRQKSFRRRDLAGFTHVPAKDAIPDDGSAGGQLSATKIKRAYVKGNKRVLIEPDLTDAQTEDFLNHVNEAFEATKNSTGHAITIHVPSGDRSFRPTRRGVALGYVYRGDSTRVHVNPQLARGDRSEATSSGGHHMAAAGDVHPATYTMVHELGHITDFKNDHTFSYSSFHALGKQHSLAEVRSDANRLHAEQRRNLSRYGATQPVEGYAEAFAHHHLRHVNQRHTAQTRIENAAKRGIDLTNSASIRNDLAADSYARRYGW